MPSSEARVPDGTYAAIVRNDNRTARAFVLPGAWRARELVVTSESAYEVQVDPAQANGDDSVTVTLPPSSLVSMVPE